MPSSHLKKPMAVIGLTGGIACGKSTLSRYFQDKGVLVIDADKVSREVTQKDSPALNALVARFGEEILLENGELDRKKLGRMVFGDPKKVALLNAITHPAIVAGTGKKMADAQRAGWAWVIYEAALIYENGLDAGMSASICVLCQEETQVRRVAQRDGISQEDAQKRISAQTSNDIRREKATWVVENDQDLESLKQKAESLYETLVERFGSPFPS